MSVRWDVCLVLFHGVSTTKKVHVEMAFCGGLEPLFV